MKELVAIQGELKAPKNLYNKFGGYNYRSAESILEALKPLLTEKKCILTISDEVKLIGDRYYIEATATLSNGTEEVSTKAYAREEESKKGMDASQLTGSTSSYARKYALNGLFALDDNKDADDADNRDNGTKTATAKPTSKTISKEELPSDNFDAKAVTKIVEGMKSMEELKEYWNNNPNWQRIEIFKNIINNKSAKLKG